jgi:hypothetical protein
MLFFYKKLISKITPIYDSTNLNCRSKAYLLTYVVLKQQNELLIQFANSKFVFLLRSLSIQLFQLFSSTD